MTPRRGPSASIATTRRRHRPSFTILRAALMSVSTVVIILVSNLPSCHARRGALVRDGMNSKSAWDNPLLGRQAGDITMDPDVVAITTRCSKWVVDPITTPFNFFDTDSIRAEDDSIRKIVNESLSKDVRTLPLHVTFRSKTLAGGKRPNWMRASATLGEKDPSILNLSKTVPLRAVWTCSNADADSSSLSYEEMHSPTSSKNKKSGEVGKNVLEDSYEDCLKRLYGKYVELEVLLPKTKKQTRMMISNNKGGPPPSIVYRVPIQTGHVNPMGMVSKSRATVTLYPYGRTLATSSSSSSNSAIAAVVSSTSSSREGVREGDLAIPLGLTNVHLPLGPGLVDPSWAKGRKIFWKGRSVGLI